MYVPLIRLNTPQQTLEQIEAKMGHHKPYPVPFGYSHYLKTMWKKGQLPQIKTGFYGDKLTLRNVSLEHLQPKSKGGKTELENLVLASNRLNNARGDRPLIEFIDFKAMARYLEQFRNLKVKGFDGNKYIAMILNKVGELLQ